MLAQNCAVSANGCLIKSNWVLLHVQDEHRISGDPGQAFLHTVWARRKPIGCCFMCEMNVAYREIGSDDLEKAKDMKWKWVQDGPSHVLRCLRVAGVHNCESD